jgi:hypothetical protein
MKTASIVKFPFKRTIPKPPAMLKKAGRKLWLSIQNEYNITDAGGAAYLTAACRIEDDISDARQKIAAEGAMIVDHRGQKQTHPLLRILPSMETIRRQNLAALNLNVEPLHDRPGRPGGK